MSVDVDASFSRVPPKHADSQVQLLWSLKDAYQRATGEAVRVTDLLSQRGLFEDFVRRASMHSDPVVRGLAIQLIGRRDTAERHPAESLGLADRVTRVDSLPEPGGNTSQESKGVPAASRSGEMIQRVAVVGAAAVVMVAGVLFIWNSLATTPALKAQDRTAAAVAGVSVPGSDRSRDVVKEPENPRPAGEGVRPKTAPQMAVGIRIHGSNTMGEELTPNLLRAFYRSRGDERLDKIDGPRSGEIWLEPTGDARLRYAAEVHAHGSSTAFSQLAAREADIGQSSRRIKPEEVERLAPHLGELNTPSSEHVVGLDGLAVVVHESNPIRELTIRDIARVFSGEISDWSELGGEPGRIHRLARDDKSGTWDTFKTLVLDAHAKGLDSSAQRFESSSELISAVASDRLAIGFAGLSYVRGVRAVAVSEHGGATALLPTPFTVATEDYPLSRRLYFYAPSAPDKRLVREFLEFVHSPQGQAIVEETGFISLDVRLEKPRIGANPPADYADEISDAQRLSVNFRFESGSNVLDSKAFRDLDRVVAFLRKDQGRDVLLFGFADASGSVTANSELSARRAKVIEQELTARGILPRIVAGFGAAMPVASNETEVGRNKNRRVEVWVR